MFKSLSLSAKLYSGFGAVLLIVSALGLFAYLRLVEIRECSVEIVEEDLPGVQILGEVDALVRRNTVFVTRHVLFTTKEGMEKAEMDIAENSRELTSHFEAYEKLITDEKERDLFDAIIPLRKAYRAVVLEKLVPLSRDGRKQDATHLLNGEYEEAYDKYRDAVLSLQKAKKAAADASGAVITKDVHEAVEGIVIGLLAAVALGASIGIFLSRSISNALNLVITSLSSGSEQVSTASQQVSQSSQSMAQGASEQASALEETSASLEEISSMTRQNSDNARQANAMAAETRSAVEKSREAMARMGDAITRIKGSSDQTAKIIKTIDEIAFQTNLLALNAAVEAARAGDAGKGFAVVAEEVRNLAQRSAEAAKSTASLIEESQQNANDGVSVSGEVAEILAGIVDCVQKLTQLIGGVSAANEEQSRGIGQIGTAVSEMDKLTQSNAANAEESASASEELAAQARELGEMVQVLVGIVKGASRAKGSYGSPGGGFSGAPASAAARRAAPRRPSPPAPGKLGRSLSGRAAPGFPREGRHATGPAATAAGTDWSPGGTADRNGHGYANAAKPGNRAAGAEQVIPMGESDVRDF